MSYLDTNLFIVVCFAITIYNKIRMKNLPLFFMGIVLLFLFQNCSSSFHVLNTGEISTASTVDNSSDTSSESQNEINHAPILIEPVSKKAKKVLFIMSGQSNSWGLGNLNDLNKENYKSWQRYNNFDFKDLSFLFYEAFNWRPDLYPNYPNLDKLVAKEIHSQQFESVFEKFSQQHEWMNSTSNFDSEFGAEIGIAGVYDRLDEIEIYKEAYPGYSIQTFLPEYFEEGISKKNSSYIIKGTFDRINKSVNDDKTDIVFVWHQGESDANAKKSSDYDKNLLILLKNAQEKLQQKFPKSKIWNFIISIYGSPPPNSVDFPSKHWELVRSKQKEVVFKQEKNTILLMTDNLSLSSDQIHLNSESQLALGECIGKLSQNLINNSIYSSSENKIFKCLINDNSKYKSGEILPVKSF